VNASLFFVVLILGSVAAAMFAYGKGKRIIAILFGVVAFFLVFGVAAWRDSLSSLIATPRALAIFGAILVISGIATWHEVVTCHMHHHVRTPVVAIVFGTSSALAIGSGTRLLRRLATTPAGASHALSAGIHQMQSGHAASHGHSATPLVIGVMILAVLVVVGMRHRRGRPAGSLSGPRRPAALPPGGKPIGSVSPAAAMANRPAVTSGRKGRR
jgi:hypothetical protein